MLRHDTLHESTHEVVTPVVELDEGVLADLIACLPEEVLDELSDKKLRRYLDKGHQSRGRAVGDIDPKHYPGRKMSSKTLAAVRKIRKREAGMERANSKLNIRHGGRATTNWAQRTAGTPIRKEDIDDIIESLDEWEFDALLTELGDTKRGRKMLGRYIRAAAVDTALAGMDRSHEIGQNRFHSDKTKKNKRRITNRVMGLTRAGERLAKEEVDFLDILIDTLDEMNYKRGNVKGGKGESNRYASRQMRRKRSRSDAKQDSMRDVMRSYRKGIPK